MTPSRRSAAAAAVIVAAAAAAAAEIGNTVVAAIAVVAPDHHDDHEDDEPPPAAAEGAETGTVTGIAGHIGNLPEKSLSGTLIPWYAAERKGCGGSAVCMA